MPWRKQLIGAVKEATERGFDKSAVSASSREMEVISEFGESNPGRELFHSTPRKNLHSSVNTDWEKRSNGHKAPLQAENARILLRPNIPLFSRRDILAQAAGLTVGAFASRRGRATQSAAKRTAPTVWEFTLGRGMPLTIAWH